MDSIVVVRFQDDDAAVALEAKIHEYAQAYLMPIIGSDILALRTDNVGFDNPLIISIGGDGTFLRAAQLALTTYPDHAIFPINAGHLGFLTNGRKFNGFDHLVQALDETFNPDSTEIMFEHRMALRARVTDDGHPRFLALNEFFVACGQNEMMTYKIFVNDHQVAELSGSGVLVSTATGSTAHALSAGGPIISPDTNVMQIVPVVSHSLTSRPIVISGRNTIAIETESTYRNTVHLHGDGKQLYEVGPTKIQIEKYPTRVKIVRPHDWDFYNVLSRKMGWNSV